MTSGRRNVWIKCWLCNVHEENNLFSHEFSLNFLWHSNINNRIILLFKWIRNISLFVLIFWNIFMFINYSQKKTNIIYLLIYLQNLARLNFNYQIGSCPLLFSTIWLCKEHSERSFHNNIPTIKLLQHWLLKRLTENRPSQLCSVWIECPLQLNVLSCRKLLRYRI